MMTKMCIHILCEPFHYGKKRTILLKHEHKCNFSFTLYSDADSDTLIYVCVMSPVGWASVLGSSLQFFGGFWFLGTINKRASIWGTCDLCLVFFSNSGLHLRKFCLIS